MPSVLNIVVVGFFVNFQQNPGAWCRSSLVIHVNIKEYYTATIGCLSNLATQILVCGLKSVTCNDKPHKSPHTLKACLTEKRKSSVAFYFDILHSFLFPYLLLKKASTFFSPGLSSLGESRQDMQFQPIVAFCAVHCICLRYAV